MDKSTIASLLQQGQAETALHHCDQQIAQGDSDPELVMFKGLAQNALGRGEEAGENLRRAAFAAPTNHNPQYHYAHWLQTRGELELALEHYQQALAARADFLPAVVNMAACAERLGQAARSREIFESAPEALKRRPEWLISRAAFEERTGNPQVALHFNQTLLASDPGNYRALLNSGVCHARLQQFGDALALYQELIDANPQEWKARFYTGNVYLAMQRYDTAIDHFHDALRIKPDASEVSSNLAIALDRRGRRQAGEEVLRAALQLQPESLSLRFNLAALLSRSTQPDDLQRSSEILVTLLSANPSFADAHACMGAVLSKIGNHVEAIEAVRKAIALTGSQASYQKLLARVYRDAGQIEDAIAVLAPLSQSSQDPEVHRELGINRLRVKQFAGAKQALQTALGLDTSDQRTVAHLLVVSELLGEHHATEALFDQSTFVAEVSLTVAGLGQGRYASLEDFNAQLEDAICSHPRLVWEPVGLATINGAMVHNLLDDSDTNTAPVIADFGSWLRRQIELFIAGLSPQPGHPFLGNIPANFDIQMWASVLETNGYIGAHIHEQSWLSGAYYVTLPDLSEVDSSNAQELEGYFEFGVPHADIPWSDDIAASLIKPEPGKLILFPSFAFHRTIPFAKAAKRISISFDVTAA